MKRFILAICCAVALAATFVSQVQQGKLAGFIQAGNRKAALDMIRSGADVNEAQPDGTRPIHWAVYRVDYELMEALLAKKAKANVANELGSTPLAEAVKLDETRMVRMLLDAGSGPEGANPDGETALMLAIKTGDVALVQMLVDAGANVNAVEKVQDQTPLMWAVASNQNAAEMTKILISKGANVKARARFTDWPSQMTSEPRAQYHSYGGLNVLLYAARSGCNACVEQLVSAGADVNVPNPEGITPLMIALDNSHNDVGKFLLDHGANPHVWDVYGRTALYIAVDKKPAAGGGAGAGGRGGAGAAPGGAGGRGGAGAAPGGAGRGAGAPGAAAPGAAAGQVAGAGAGGRGGGAGAGAAAGGRGGAGGGGGARGGAGAGGNGPAVSSMDIINALIAAGVDLNPQLSARRPEAGSGGRFNDPLLSTGCTPLLDAVIKNDMEVVTLLLNKGANPNINAMATTPFLQAAGVGGGGRGGGAPAAVNTALLDLFLAHGADINSQVTGATTYSMKVARSAATGNDGLTALHAAVQSGRVDMVRYLLEKGARTDVADAMGRTPKDLLSAGARGGSGAAAPPLPAAVPAAGGGGRGGGGRNAANDPEILALLQSAAAKK